MILHDSRWDGRSIPGGHWRLGNHTSLEPIFNALDISVVSDGSSHLILVEILMREIDDVSIALLENPGAASNVNASWFHAHLACSKLLECSGLGRIDGTLYPIILASSKLYRLPYVGLRIIQSRILVHLELR